MGVNVRQRPSWHILPNRTAGRNEKSSIIINEKEYRNAWENKEKGVEFGEESLRVKFWWYWTLQTNGPTNKEEQKEDAWRVGWVVAKVWRKDKYYS